jgi:hypothetical protein
LAALRYDLNRDAVCFPGTRLRLRYGVAEGPKAERADRS